PRRALSFSYSISVNTRPRRTLIPQALEADGESSMIVSVTKLKRKGERGQPCRIPLGVTNLGESSLSSWVAKPLTRLPESGNFTRTFVCLASLSWISKSAWINDLSGNIGTAEKHVYTSFRSWNNYCIVIIITIIDSMTSVFNTYASLSYNHDLFESLIVKKRIKCLQPGAVKITRSPSWKASSTDRTQAFRDLLHTPLPSQGLATSLFTPLRIGHGKQYSLRQTMASHGLSFILYPLSPPLNIHVMQFERIGDFWIEGKTDPKGPTLSYFDCFYFLLVTVATVGYGDIVCTTFIGRVVIIMVIIGALAGCEASMIVSIAKLKRKCERGQPCRPPLDVVNSGESFPAAGVVGSPDSSLGELRVQFRFGFNLLVTVDREQQDPAGSTAPIPTSTQKRNVKLTPPNIIQIGLAENRNHCCDWLIRDVRLLNGSDQTIHQADVSLVDSEFHTTWFEKTVDCTASLLESKSDSTFASVDLLTFAPGLQSGITMNHAFIQTL
ncbi:hypothetical protein T265_14525, partial [Opisthorchis viverrini]